MREQHGKRNNIDNTEISQIPREIVDLILDEQTSMNNVDALKIIAESRARTLGALKRQTQEFHSFLESSDKLLRSHLGSKVHLIILYVDLVDSTHMSMVLSLEKLTTILQAFIQEMTIVVANNHGYVLKYVGDAIIAYFPLESSDWPVISKRAIMCALNMLITVEYGINEVLQRFGYPDLHIKIGIDSGENAIINYGQSGTKSHIDMLGYPMIITAKITSMAEADHIMIGKNTYQLIDTELRQKLTKLGLKTVDYIDYQTGDSYLVFSLGLSNLD